MIFVGRMLQHFKLIDNLPPDKIHHILWSVNRVTPVQL